MAQIYKLTALKIKNAKPKDKEYHLSDGGGLYLRVYPNGTKSYILIYKKGNKRAKQTLGLTSEITLEQARKLAEQAMEQKLVLPNDIIDREITFEKAFEEYRAIKEQGLSISMRKKIASYKEKFFSKLDKLPLAQIKRKEVLSALEYLIVNNYAGEFQSARSILSVFFGWAVQKEYCEHNVARDIEAKYFFTKRSTKHHAHFSELADILGLKKTIENCGSSYNVKLLFMFLLYTAVRPCEARLATWDELDLDKGIWKIPAHRMKMKKPHEVVLSKQILKALKEHKKNSNAEGYCFKNFRKTSISPTGLLNMIKYVGYQYKISLHGLRGTFATIANELREEHGFGNDIVQACLAHETQNAVASAYNHAEYKKSRAKLLQWWADKLGDIDIENLKNRSRFYHI